jgi:hypothetical protein
MVESDIEKMGDEAALKKLLELLLKQDVLVFGTKDGPLFLALLRWFGLVAPHENQSRLELLEPELVCRILVEHEKLKLKLSKYQAKSNFSSSKPCNLSTHKS